jgi:hypothetical protein
MKREEIIKNSKSYKIGYEDGKKNGKELVIKQVVKFVDEECRFIADIYSDSLLDRLVKVVKKI